jgi:hypothetical protein
MIFIFFVEGGKGGGGVLGVLIDGSEFEWEMRRTGWGGDQRGALCTRVHTSHNENSKCLENITTLTFKIIHDVFFFPSRMLSHKFSWAQ